jgi:putative flavoprotein involved in K+ transport
VEYLAAYEKRYALPIRRSEPVTAVSHHSDGLRVTTDTGEWVAGAVISATGTWSRPFLPAVPGSFTGRQLHTVDYRSAREFNGQSVVVVGGGGNSGAQIAADLTATATATATWVTQSPPRYLPDHIDGRALFGVATRRRQALESGQSDTGGVAAG